MLNLFCLLVFFFKYIFQIIKSKLNDKSKSSKRKEKKNNQNNFIVFFFKLNIINEILIKLSIIIIKI
jgi:hypothetical protein